MVREVSRINLRDLDVDQVFYNFWDNQSENGAFYVRARDTAAAARAIRAVVTEVEPRLPVQGLTTVDGQIDRSLSTESALATLSTGFGGLADHLGRRTLRAHVASRHATPPGDWPANGARRHPSSDRLAASSATR